MVSTSAEHGQCVICRSPCKKLRKTCSPECAAKHKRNIDNARKRNREHQKRGAVSDVTPAQEIEMRKRTRKCRKCGKYMTNKPGLPNSKHLDHIIPICMGGTHTHGNVRIICADCNLHRPKDGSDFTGQPTLWAVMPGVIARPHASLGEVRGTCRKGLHPWVPENIGAKTTGQRYCKPCQQASELRRGRNSRTCACGAPLGNGGRTIMCPDCMTMAAQQAIRLRETGLTWDEIAPMVGYASGTGIWYVARRIMNAGTQSAAVAA